MNRPTSDSQIQDLPTKVLHWVYEKRKQVLIVSATVLVVFIGGLVGMSWWNHHCEKAAVLLYKAKKINGDESAKIASLEELVKDYDCTPSGKLASLQLGDVYFAKSEFQKAVDYYKIAADVSDRRVAIKAAALNNIARCYEEMNDYETAISYYMKAFGDSSNTLRGLSYFAVAGCYEKLGKIEEAKKVYQELLDKEDISSPALKLKSEERLIWIASSDESKQP